MARATLEQRPTELPDKIGELRRYFDGLLAELRTASDIEAAGAEVEDAGAPQNRLQIPLLQSGVLQQLMRTRTGGVLLGASFCGKHPSPAMIAVGCDTFLQQDHRPLLPILRAAMREDRYPRLAEIAVPTVVMVGSADRTTPPSHARRLAAGVPGARLVTVPDAGHVLNWEAPDALVDVIGSFRERPVA